MSFSSDVKVRVGIMAFWGALWLAPSPARAQGAEVLIRCDELSAEERARVEVRLLTELRTLPNPPGILELSCERNSVRGGWLKDGKLYDARNLSVASGDNRTEMLLWISSLLLETEGDRPPDSPLKESTVEVPPPPPDGEARVLEAPAEIPAVPTAAKSTTPAQTEPPPRAQASEEEKGGKAVPIALEAGLAYAHYGSELDGALGPKLGAHLTIFQSFGASLDASFLFATEEPASLETLEGTLFLGADFTPFSLVRLLLGPSLSWARVSDPSTARASLTVGVEASVKAYFPRPLGLFAQAGVRGLADERRVLLTDPGGAASITGTFIPHWSTFFAIGGALDLSQR